MTNLISRVCGVVAVGSAALASLAAEPVKPSVPAGVTAWNHPVALRLNVADCARPHEPLGPIALVGAKGGVFSGQVVISSAQPLKGLKAAASELKAEKEGATIPASAVEFRYALLDGIGHYWGNTPTYDGLDTVAPAEKTGTGTISERSVGNGASPRFQPVWITVRVPRDAKPGLYAGRVAITLAGAGDVVVPLQVKVHDWALPEPKDFLMEPGLTQSPESVALKYNVPLWSDRHWALLDRTLTLLGEVGTKSIYITAIARTDFGNEHAMLRWVKDDVAHPPSGVQSQPGATALQYRPDFSIVEKYLDLAVKDMGNVPVVVLYAWDINLGSTMFYAKEQVGEDKIKGATITVVDPKTQELTYAVAPKPGTPESAAFWKPAFDGMKAVLAKRGLERSLAIGVAGDMRPNKFIVADFKSAAPDVPWVVCSHGFATNLWGQPTVLIASVWGAGRPADPARKRLYGWQQKGPIVTTFARSGSGGIGKMSPGFALAVHRLGLEGCMAAGLRGWMRLGADFWPVVKDPRGRPQPLVDRYFSWGGLAMTDTNTTYVLAPGQDGPVATERYEMLREGTQECEARAMIERALLDPAKRAKLGEADAKRFQDLLDERTRTLVSIYQNCPEPIAEELGRKVIPERSDRLYAAAAEVAKALE